MEKFDFLSYTHTHTYSNYIIRINFNNIDDLRVHRTVWRKCPASKFNQELRRTVRRYGARRTNISIIYAGRSGVMVSGVHIYLLFTPDGPA